MARRSPAETLRHIHRVMRAWERLAPNSVFYGMTLAQFRDAARPSLETRAEIADLERRLKQLLHQRKFADSRFMQEVEGVVSGVKGDPKFGQDSPLYAAMGYVLKSARGKRRKKRKTST